MKFLCIAFVIAAFIGSALGDAEGGDAGTETLAGASPVCDIQLGETQTLDDVPDILMQRMGDCFLEEVRAVKRAMNTSHTTVEYQNIIKKFCDEVPTMNTCTADVASNVHKCLNELQTATFKVMRNDLETVLNVGCEEDGVKMAAITEAIRNQGEVSELRSTISSCLKHAEADLKQLNPNDPAGTSISIFRFFKVLKICIADHGEGQIAVSSLVQSLLGDIMKKIKCVHPESHDEVLCETIAEN